MYHKFTKKKFNLKILYGVFVIPLGIFCMAFLSFRKESFVSRFFVIP
jgi:hypothetical protein